MTLRGLPTHLRVPTFKTSLSSSMNADRAVNRWTSTEGQIFNLKSDQSQHISTLARMHLDYFLRNSSSQPQKIVTHRLLQAKHVASAQWKIKNTPLSLLTDGQTASEYLFDFYEDVCALKCLFAPQ